MKAYLTISAILILLTIGCQKEAEVENMTDTSSIILPDQESWNSEIILTSAGKKIAVVRAGHTSKFNNSKLAKLDEDIIVDFFNAEEKHTSKLTASSGEVNEKSHDLVAIGNVIVVSDSGATLYTERLVWKDKTKKIISDVEVKITTEADTLYGIGFESDAGLNNWIIKNPRGVTDRVRSDDDEI